MKSVQVEITSGVHRLMWHGTSSSALRSILKNGLVYSKRNVKNYDVGDNQQAIVEGTYLSTLLSTAFSYARSHARKTNSSPVVVLCDIAMGQENTFADEDNVLSRLRSIQPAIRHAFGDASSMPSRGDKEKHVKAICTDFIESLHAAYGIPMNRLEKWIIYNSDIVRWWMDVEIQRIIGWNTRDKALRAEWDDESPRVRSLIKEIAKRIGSLSSAFGDRTPMLDMGGLNMAISQPIKFKGARKIVAIFAQDSDSTPSYMIFRQVYGDNKWRKVFLNDWKKHVSSYYSVNVTIRDKDEDL